MTLNLTEKSFWKTERIKIAALYTFMLAGGFWHVLNVLQDIMRLMASITMVAVSLWLVYELWQFHRDKIVFRRTLYWLGLVFVISLFIENIGVQSGQIFGNYVYGDTLKPFIGDVPVAIGFAWINMLLASAAVAHLLLNARLTERAALTVVVIAALMVIFDAVMEQAAGKLGYWTWASGEIPFQNYIAWFVIAFGFALLGMLMRIFNEGIPKIIRHAYFAQLGYFFLVNLK